MKFKWLNLSGVESDEGFIVQSKDRFTIEYRVGPRFINVAVEQGESAGKPCVTIADDAFQSWSNSSEPISAAEQKRMFENFKAAMAFQGLAVF